MEQDWQEGVGGLLRLSAAHETALLSQLQGALPTHQDIPDVPQASTHQLFQPQHSLLLTLLFLNAVGLRRMWDLRSYTGRELARLSGRPQHYSYRHSERFLFTLAMAHADEALTTALARWTATLWQAGERNPETSSPQFYLDGHRKAVYTQTLSSARTHWALG